MKVLIITYYWPPSGGSGVQRWLKFVKYLQEFKIYPVVYTVKDPTYAIEDATLENEIPKDLEVIRYPILEPYKFANIFSRYRRSAKINAGFLNSKRSFFGNIIAYARANFFVPDARKFWIKPSIKYLEKYLKKNTVDGIITSAPPHSLHLIGLGLKEKLGIKWISDFRDPWTSIDYFDHLPMTKKVKEKHFYLEKKVLEKSDAVIVVGKNMRENYLKYNSNTYVLSNGFDNYFTKFDMPLDKKFSLTHVGMLNEDRNPKILWKVLRDLIDEVEGFSDALEIQFIGKVDKTVLNSISSNELEKQFKQIDYVSHYESSIYQQKSQVLLLLVNKVSGARGIITGKVFEYLAVKRPILAIGPENGDLAEILKETKGGTIVDFDNYKKLKYVILDLYFRYKKNDLKVSSKNIEQYHRREITLQLSKLLKNIF